MDNARQIPAPSGTPTKKSGVDCVPEYTFWQKIATKKTLFALKFFILYKSSDNLSMKSTIFLSFLTSIYRMGFIGLSAPMAAICDSLAKFAGCALSVRSARRSLAELETRGYVRRRQARLGEYANAVLLEFTPKMCDMSDKNLHRPKETDFRSLNNINNLPTYIDPILRETTQPVLPELNQKRQEEKKMLDELVSGLCGASFPGSNPITRKNRPQTQAIQALQTNLSVEELGALRLAAEKLRDMQRALGIDPTPCMALKPTADQNLLTREELAVLQTANERLRKHRRVDSSQPLNYTEKER